MKYVVAGLCAYAVCLIHTAVFTAMGSGIFPFLPLICVIIIALALGPLAGAVAGLSCGLLLEGNAVFPLLTYVAPLTLAGLFAGLYRRDSGPRQAMAAGILCVLALGAINLRLGYAAAMGGAVFSIPTAFTRLVLPELLWTFLVLGIAIVVFIFIKSRTEE
ncbi:MAG: hypothetical protein FWD16_00310 [Clostridia bacterium]|nr:hypothetical protein [Clostridia bacterium]